MLESINQPSKEKINRYDCTEGPVAVIGAGLTGASWAGLFCAHGRTVFLYDIDSAQLADGRLKAIEIASFLHQQGLVENIPRSCSSHRVVHCSSLADAVKEAVFIQEAAFDSYETKESIFREIDRLAPPRSIIASSTSGLSISRIQKAAKFPERCLAGHPYNPPHLIPLVEVAPGELTAYDALIAAQSFYESVGKEPIVLQREIPGYLANRMSAALWREAINLVLSGVATVEDVDKAINLGPGLRWSIMGPHLLYHLGGGSGGIRNHIAQLQFTKETMWRDMDSWETLPEETADILSNGLPSLDAIEELAKERDQTLIGVLKALKKRRPKSGKQDQ